MSTRFNEGIADKLGHYVYGLKDPRNGRLFYIGQGVNNRVFNHEDVVRKLRDGSSLLSEKEKVIKEILDEGLSVDFVVIAHRLSESEADLVEACLIEVNKDILTNSNSGNGVSNLMMTVEELNDMYKPEYLTDDGTVKFAIVKVSQDTIEERGSLYAATMSAWRMSPESANNIDYILSSVNGVIREVYKVTGWRQVPNNSKRIEFTGCEPESNIKKLFRNKRIPKEFKYTTVQYSKAVKS